ncbi:zinc metallopeptidase [Halalkalibacterium halodurans]|uniref:zinc metallopeptidase n=1 Tax=Halalkalibacterium halodurans TaxID=86665 RepID=UPI002AAA430E|nr:zinc metallopeptidase [Halalkalibacterium halodurans]MDY7221534.1 zinc metallopeptidase [Halalkalibacterium halodurans]MDY7240810.1 zinc metallopeptidase [Halalkalibacterium halodurans]MED3647817.1 zinc metallopeptidase [Halalkalibacterium halodurans]MED4125617.1 zinc metallopeptidase [Halalkalibacterium halodurans]
MFFHPMDILIFAALGLALWAQSKVKGNFQKWSRVAASSNATGAQVARFILNKEGLHHVKVERSKSGTLSDHYDPRAKTVRLSDPVYQGHSISALAVAAHEVGHAIQDQHNYSMLVIRHRLFPIASIGSQLAPWLFIAGFLLEMTNLIGVGIILFSGAVLFQVVTLPVEFDASRRAKDKLLQLGLIQSREEKGIGQVLNAAALTYVASTLMAVLQLIKFIMIFRGRR